MGADELILLEDPAFVTVTAGRRVTRWAAIKKIGKFDLIFCGRQAADSRFGTGGRGNRRNSGIAAGKRGQEN